MDLEQNAIEKIRLASEMSFKYYGEPIICTYSGGKDSDVLLELFKRSGVPFEVQYSFTTADAPQTFYHINSKFKELEEAGIKCTINKPTFKGRSVTMWTLIPQMGMPPTRFQRYCCSVFKEQNGKNRFIATGVRRAESTKRKNRNEIETFTSKSKDSIKITFDELSSRDNDESKGLLDEVFSSDNDKRRRLIEHCQVKGKMIVNPIVDWYDRDVWDFIKSECITINPLYSCGDTRVGCIGCPMSGYKGMTRAFERFPTYKTSYIHTFDRMLAASKAKGIKTKWKTGEDVFHWWIQDPNIEGQMSLSDYEEIMKGE